MTKLPWRLLAGLSFLVVSCAPPTPSGSSVPQPAAPAEQRSASQVLRLAAPAIPSSASPESTSAQNYVFNAQFDSMVYLDGKFNLSPAAATKWEMLPNENAWRFTIRPDLTFSNGEKVTAEDIVFTANLIATATPPLPQKSVLAKLTGARVVDATTIDLLTSEKDASVLYGMPYFLILPAKYYQEVGRDQFSQKPIGSGPYELTEYRPSDGMTYKLRSTPHPFRKPIVTEIRWKAVPEPSALFSGIRTGEIDGVFTGLTIDQVEQARRDNLYNVGVSPTNLTLAIDKAAAEKSTPALLDNRVRQALQYAIDREAIIKTLYRGFATPINQIAIPGTPAYDTSIPAIPYDPAKAKALLTEAGYPNGFKVANPVDYQNVGANSQVMLTVQDYWKQIGVEVTLNTVENAVWTDKMYARNNAARNEFTQSSGQDNNGLLLYYRGFITCANPPARILWCVPAFDTNMNAAYAEPDQTKRNELIRTAVRLHTAENPYIYILAAPTYVVGGAKVRDMNVEAATFWRPDTTYRID